MSDSSVPLPMPGSPSIVDDITSAYLAAEDATRKQRRRRKLRAESIPPGGAPNAFADPVFSLRPSAIWSFFRSQPASFWLACIYLFFEYIRPQAVYPALAILPWSKLVIGMAVAAFFIEGGKLRFGLGDALLAIFTATILLSSVEALRPDASYAALGDWFSWVVIYLLIANVVVTERRFLVFMLSFLLWNFKMSQHGARSWATAGFAFRSWGTNGSPGWFSNSGEFGIEMCVVLPIIIAFRMSLAKRWSWKQNTFFWLMLATTVLSIVGSSSRGALVGCAAVVLWTIPRSRYKWRALGSTIVIGALVYLFLPAEQLARLKSSGDDKTSEARILYWHRGLDVLAQRPLTGIGYNNWESWHKASFGYTALPHNIFIQAGAELGYTGLVAFALLIIGTVVINAQTRRLMARRGPEGRFLADMANGLDAAMIGFLASGFFVTVLYYPFFWINLAMTVALNRAAAASMVQVPAAASRSRRMVMVRRGRPTLRGA